MSCSETCIVTGHVRFVHNRSTGHGLKGRDDHVATSAWESGIVLWARGGTDGPRDVTLDVGILGRPHTYG